MTDARLPYNMTADQIVLETKSRDAMQGNHFSLMAFHGSLSSHYWALNPEALDLVLRSTSLLFKKFSHQEMDDMTTFQLICACLDTALTWECG